MYQWQAVERDTQRDHNRHVINEARTAHNVARRLNDNENKFSGDLAQCWQDFADNYSQIASDYNLTDEHKLKYFHNLLTKDAHRFYVDTVKSAANTYSEAFKLLEGKFNSVVRQTRVKNHLSNLRVRSYESEDTDTAAALYTVYKRILTLSRQVVESHGRDVHKIEFLREAVVGYDWSREPLSRIATASLTFQQLYA